MAPSEDEVAVGELTVWAVGREVYVDCVVGEAGLRRDEEESRVERARDELYRRLAALAWPPDGEELPEAAGPACAALRFGADYVVRSLLSREREQARRAANARMAEGRHIPTPPTSEVRARLDADMRKLCVSLLTSWRLWDGTPLGEATRDLLEASVRRREAGAVGDMVSLLFERKVLNALRSPDCVDRQLTSARLDLFMAQAVAEAPGRVA